MTLARCKVTIEAQTDDGELVAVSVPWDSDVQCTPDILTLALERASRRIRAALDATRPAAVTFGDAKRATTEPEVAPTFGSKA